MNRLICLLALSCACAAQPLCSERSPRSAQRAERPNIVLVVLDDVGVDLVSGYREGSDPACTPAIDSLAASGVLFRNAWSNPLCSPTRAQILTGLHGFRSGIGGLVPQVEAFGGLDPDLFTLPAALRRAAYDCAAVGKWHLADGGQGLGHPFRCGFDSYAGAMANLHDYFAWIKNRQGEAVPTSRYATLDTLADAQVRLRRLRPPWFLYVAFNAAHKPLHEPPAELCPAGGGLYGCGTMHCARGQRARAMVESLDRAVGRLLASVAEVDPRAYVIVIGDNGSIRDATRPPFDAAHAKGTLYEGGVNVPLIIAGPGAGRGECEALVSAVDLFATVLELAGVPGETADSVSLVPYLSDPGAEPLRKTVYAEWFFPNFDPFAGAFAPREHVRAVRNGRYKLIRGNGDLIIRDEFYDLQADPFEQVDLYPPQTAEERANYEALSERLEALGVD